MKICFYIGCLLLSTCSNLFGKVDSCVITINYKNNINFKDKILLQTLDMVPKFVDSLNLPQRQGTVSFIFRDEDTWADIAIKSDRLVSFFFVTSSGELVFELDCAKKTFDIIKSNKKTEDFERTNDELRAFLLKFVRQKRSLDSSISINDTISIGVKEKKLNFFLEQEYSSFISKAKNEPFYQISALIAVHLSDHNTRNNLRFKNNCIELYDFLIQKFPNTTTFSILKEQFERSTKPLEIGKNFKIPDKLLFKKVDGGLQSLNEIIEKSKSNAIVLEFWASWCGPCRQNHPEIRKLSDKYPALEIIFISIDENDDNWFRAIQKDNLTKFRHLIDNTGWEAMILKENNVSQIPFNVVLDNKKQIIGTNIYGSDLESLVKINSVK